MRLIFNVSPHSHCSDSPKVVEMKKDPVVKKEAVIKKEPGVKKEKEEKTDPERFAFLLSSLVYVCHIPNKLHINVTAAKGSATFA